ncbi:HAMP domain-containing protein [Klebsiella variicola subsp. variicola]|nr:HAMP domain-containing protein [Klebsiella variicola subsp. variicola]
MSPAAMRQRAIAVLYGKAYETELERMQTQIDRFRQMLEHRAAIAIDQATERSRIWRTLSEIMVGLTALMFLFVLGFILKRRVLYPVVRLSDVVQRLASQDYAVETPHFTQVDEIGDMAQAIRIFRENGLARQQLEQQRDADWAIRELLARMTQRLQGCETIEDVIKVAELFAPNIAPTIPGKLYILDTDPWQMRCVAQWLSPAGGRRRPLLPTTAGRYGGDSAIRRCRVSPIHLLSSAGGARRPVALRTAHRPGRSDRSAELSERHRQ